jgi:hypothetical protein
MEMDPMAVEFACGEVISAFTFSSDGEANVIA